jgi:sRNA-binding regulator protein Hfq
MVNRKLVRPNLAEIKERLATQPHVGSEPPYRDTSGNGASKRRPVPPDGTAAEAFYYLKQMNQKTPMVLQLDNGEELRGHIEWYDRNCVKVHRDGSPNLLVFKHSIRYMFKQEEEGEHAAE